MSNLILIDNPNNNDTNPEVEPTETITPSTEKKRSKHKKGKTPFHFESSLTQVSATLKEATDVPNNREEDCKRKEDQCNDETAGSGGTKQTDGTKNKPNVQDKNSRTMNIRQKVTSPRCALC